MNTVLSNFVIVLQVVSALAIIGLVLLQHGKGADMGAAFGSGASGSLFGASRVRRTSCRSRPRSPRPSSSRRPWRCAFRCNTRQTTGPAGGGVMERITVPPAKGVPATGIPSYIPAPARMPARPRACLPMTSRRHQTWLSPAGPAEVVPCAQCCSDCRQPLRFRPLRLPPRRPSKSLSMFKQCMMQPHARSRLAVECGSLQSARSALSCSPAVLSTGCRTSISCKD